MKQKIAIRIEPDDLKKLREVAEATGVTCSELLRKMIAGSRLHDVQIHRKYNRELLHVLNGILGDMHQMAQHMDKRKWPDLSILERLHEIKLALSRIHQAATGSRDDS